MVRTLLTSLALLAGGVLASPIAASNPSNAQCQAIDFIVTALRAENVATPFCSTLLGIPTVTSTITQTSTPCSKTVTITTDSVDTITTTTVSTVYAVTTVYPVVAVSTTSTCALGATVIPTQSLAVVTAASTSSAPGAVSKRNTGWGPTSVPLAIPQCLQPYSGPQITSACECLNIPTPTKVFIVSTTLPTGTITKTVCSTINSVTTTTVTSTSYTSTYSGTQYYTSTFTILPPPSSTYVPAPSAAPNAVYGIYPDLDFNGLDIQNFFCYAGGPAPPAPFLSSCTNFAGCLAECEYYNTQNLGGGSTTCGAVVYNAPPSGTSGSCYLKTGVVGCGSPNGNATTGVLLPLMAADPQ